ncbi:hypothetical protein SAMN02745166_01489 [Prosthecobacter debontii]|uniref:Uncharacterized protein n=1 Tax=Prosthecobacter debontii TaxID=48467 RepID=A0A1T4XGW7_9BACT|nr:hypothetical protein [Prosthecobacter debontii]SKA88806.1 hypothetical protein SAMN02745166_01489 [Prosthecobacter debontii]
MTLEEIRADLAQQHPELQELRSGILYTLTEEERIDVLDKRAQEIFRLSAVLVPQSITRRQRNLWLGAARVLAIKSWINANITDPTEKHSALVHFNDSETTERHHPLTIQMAAIIGLTEPEQIDQAFIEASQL